VSNDAELPKVKELFGEVEDPLNLVAEAPIEEVAEALIEDGWRRFLYMSTPRRSGEGPRHFLGKAVPGLARLHIRLWRSPAR